MNLGDEQRIATLINTGNERSRAKRLSAAKLVLKSLQLEEKNGNTWRCSSYHQLGMLANNRRLSGRRTIGTNNRSP